jgi:hypothetical protein
VERELLEQYETELLEKEHSGCAALMRDDKARRPKFCCTIHKLCLCFSRMRLGSSCCVLSVTQHLWC